MVTDFWEVAIIFTFNHIESYSSLRHFTCSIILIFSRFKAEEVLAIRTCSRTMYFIIFSL